MADQVNTSGGHGGLYFIVGALVVIVGIGAFFLFGGSVSGPAKNNSIDVKIEAPKAPAKPQ